MAEMAGIEQGLAGYLAEAIHANAIQASARVHVP